MSHPESCKVSYIRASREIEPSSTLESLLGYASELLISESFADPRDPAKRTPRPSVYRSSSLRVTIFEGYATAGDEETNVLLEKLEYRLKSPTLEEINRSTTSYGKRITNEKTIANPFMKMLKDIHNFYIGKPNLESEEQMFEPLTISANNIVVSTKGQYQGHGTELSLSLDESEVASYLVSESGAYITQAAKINFARRLSWVDNDEQARQVPFMTAPFRSEAQTKEFIEQLSTVLPVVDMEVSRKLSWGRELR